MGYSWTHIHSWPNKVRMGRLCCPGISWELIRETSSHATCQRMLVHMQKDPGHSAKSVGGRLHLSTHTPLTQQSQSGLTMPLSKHNVRMWQWLRKMSSLSHCGLTLAWKVELMCVSWSPLQENQIKVQKGNESSNFPPSPCKREKSTTTKSTVEIFFFPSAPLPPA